MQRRHAHPNDSTITVFFPPQPHPLGAAERISGYVYAYKTSRPVWEAPPRVSHLLECRLERGIR
jgi:hypothetical protein